MATRTNEVSMTKGKNETGTRTAAAAPTATAGAPPVDRIAERAYEIWKASGCPNGLDQEHWFQAERELRGAQPASRTARR